MIKRLLTCLYLLVPASLNAEFREHAVPGGILVFDLGVAAERPTAHFENTRVAVVQRKGRWQAIVGIPLSTSASELIITANGETLSRKIGSHQYAEQRLKIREKRYVNPNEEELARYRRERTEMDAARALFTAGENWVFNWQPPVQGARSNSFGKRRFYNDQPRAPHSGMDISAVRGTPIVAPASARVVAIGDYFFNGKTVMLDHGQGLVTLYCHLSEIDVALHQRVDSGTQIGNVGASGRVTGPHLHWSVYLNKAAVNPALLLAGDITDQP